MRRANTHCNFRIQNQSVSFQFISFQQGQYRSWWLSMRRFSDLSSFTFHIFPGCSSVVLQDKCLQQSTLFVKIDHRVAGLIVIIHCGIIVLLDHIADVFNMTQPICHKRVWWPCRWLKKAWPTSFLAFLLFDLESYSNPEKQFMIMKPLTTVQKTSWQYEDDLNKSIEASIVSDIAISSRYYGYGNDNQSINHISSTSCQVQHKYENM